MNMIKTVELFAGVGGFRLGLETASPRYEFVWANQWEPSMKEQYAFDCYAAHYGRSADHVCQDIAKVKGTIPDHELLVGGFPCQDYSIMKKNSIGIKGLKGALWWQIDSILYNKRPRYVILENVDRILRSPAEQEGRDFSIILRCFYDKGYAVEWRVINAADYGGAQRRRRTLIIAYLDQTKRFQRLAEGVCILGLKHMHKYVMEHSILAKAFPIKTHNRAFTESWIDELAFESISDISSHQKVHLYNAGIMINGRLYSVEIQPKYEKFISLADVLEKRTIEEHLFIKEKDIHRWQYAKGPKNEQRTRKDGSKYWFSEGNVEFPEPLYRPSRTMLTSETQVGRTSHVVADPTTGRLRVLSPIECERLNGFPDNWTATGMPEKMRYFCMGNALIVPLVARIGKVLIEESEPNVFA
ncbi:MAG: DNA (cytosine-5-)-methyltransferase [Bacteroides sp.]